MRRCFKVKQDCTGILVEHSLFSFGKITFPLARCEAVARCHSGAAEQSGFFGCEYASLGEWLQTFLKIVVLSKRLEIVQRQNFKFQNAGLIIAPYVVIN